MLFRVIAVRGRDSNEALRKSNGELFKRLSGTLREVADQSLGTFFAPETTPAERKDALEVLKQVSAVGAAVSRKMDTVNCPVSVVSEFIDCWKVSPNIAGFAEFHDSSVDDSTLRCLLAKSLLGALPENSKSPEVHQMFDAFRGVKRFRDGLPRRGLFGIPKLLGLRYP